MKASDKKNLFSPVERGFLKFNSAIVMAPMTRSRAINGLPNDLMVNYYLQRSTAGLIITEGNASSPNALGYARTPGIYSDEQIAGWKKVTEAVHNNGGKIFTQLMHVGRVAHSANKPTGARTIAPSAFSANGDMWTDARGMQKKDMPHAMTHDEIDLTINEFVQAAKNAITAGFDGVELHGANGYLLEQFLNPHTNQRADAYGGTVANRIRFVLELTQAVANGIGKGRLGIRLSPYNTFNDMGAYNETAETYQHLSRKLAEIDIAYIHVIDYAARATEEGRALLSKIRADFSNLLILNGGYTRERAELAIENGEADMVSFGSAFIANPDLPYRLKNGIPLAAPDSTTFYTPGDAGYTDYEFAALQVTQ